MSEVTRPEFCTDEMLVFLDGLRIAGAVDMFGAGPYLEKQFPELGDGKDHYRSSQQARDVLMYWMKTFGEETR